MFGIHSKPDINQSKLTVCNVDKLTYLDLEALLLKASLWEEAEDRRDREAVRYLLFEAGAQGRLDCLGRPINFEREGQRELTTAPAVGAL